jgi:hypothetical protein
VRKVSIKAQPFEKKHDTSQISDSGFFNEIQAKLAYQTLIENSKTIDEIIEGPNGQDYLK